MNPIKQVQGATQQQQIRIKRPVPSTLSSLHLKVSVSQE